MYGGEKAISAGTAATSTGTTVPPKGTLSGSGRPAVAVGAAVAETGTCSEDCGAAMARLAAAVAAAAAAAAACRGEAVGDGARTEAAALVGKSSKGWELPDVTATPADVACVSVSIDGDTPAFAATATVGRTSSEGWEVPWRTPKSASYFWPKFAAALETANCRELRSASSTAARLCNCFADAMSLAVRVLRTSASFCNSINSAAAAAAK
mmetsp:Transcript_94525/g.237157  ORF Transcript_94525/g.237157 Transcript_94525/m.237157 type:complete len:210 (-) Transcript_94525:93-722(-)